MPMDDVLERRKARVIPVKAKELPPSPETVVHEAKGGLQRW
jgi:hypothetical protein